MTAEEKRRAFKFLAADHGLSVTSEHRPGAKTKSGRPSDHAHNRALDASGDPEKMAAFAEAVSRQHPDLVKEMIYSPKGHFEGGKWRKTGDRDHHDHVHVAWNDDRPERLASRGGSFDPVADAKAFAAARQKKPAADFDPVADARAFAAKRKKPAAKGRSIFEQYPPAKYGATSTPASKIPLADIKGYGQEGAAAQAAARALRSKRPPDYVNLSSPASQVRANPALARGGALTQLNRGAESATQAITNMAAPVINRVSAPLYPVRDLMNRFGTELGKASAKRGRAENMTDADVLKVLQNTVKTWKPWESFKQGVMQGKATDSEFFKRWAAGDPALRQRVAAIGGPEVADFLFSFVTDAGVGKLQSMTVKGAAKAVRGQQVTPVPGVSFKGSDVQGALEKKIPALGKAAEGRRAYIGSREVMNRNSAFFDQYLRSAEDIAEDVRRTSQRYMKQGRGKIRETDPLTGQKKNVFDELVADYMDAGNPGSKYEDIWQPRPGQSALPGASGLVPPGQRAPGNAAVSANFRRERELEEVAKRAAQYGVDFEDVRRIGDRYGGIFDELGQTLVNSGLLDEAAYQSLKGQYLPRLYLLTHGNPADVKSYLDFLKNANLIGPEELRFARERLQRRGEGSFFGKVQKGPKQFRQQREIAEFEQRSDPAKARALIPEATPAALHGIGSQARAAGEAAGHAEIALNPSWAVKVTPRKVKSSVDLDLGPGVAPGGQKALPGTVPKGPKSTTTTITAEPPEGWVKWEGGGPLSGHYVHPQVNKMLKFHSDPGMAYKWIKENYGAARAQQYQDLNNFVKRVWVSAPRTAFNNISGNIALSHSTAATRGIEKPLPAWMAGYAAKVKEIRDAARGGQISPRLQEAALETSILRESGMQVPAAAKRVGSGFGVETPLERLKQKPGEWFQAYGKTFYNDPEKAGRFHLYSELRDADYSIRDAEKIVNDAMVTYTDVGPLVRELERNAIIGMPFITFPLKAVVTASKIAVQRPDQFNTYTGERLRNFLDEFTDRKREERGLKAEAKDKRRRGEVSPLDFPIPPVSLFGQEYGGGDQTLYMRAAPLAQFQGIIASNRGGPLTENVGERLKSAIPLLNLARTLYENESTFTGFPIVPVGSIPGTKGNISDVTRSTEAAGKYAATVMKAIFPQYSDLERTYNALTETPEYGSIYAPVPRFKATMLRALTGINIAENIGENPLERAFRVEDRLGGTKPTEYTKFAFDYTREILKRRNESPGWTPSPRFQQIAASYSKETLKDAIKNAGDRLTLIITRDGSKGEERKRKIREMMDWIYSLSTAEEQQALGQAGTLTPDQRAPFSGVLGE